MHVDLTASDACSAALGIVLVGARSSEPDDAPGSGDGHTTGDVDGVGPGDDRDILLRAERSTEGPGRVYTLTYRVSDAAGNTRTVEVTVTVPPDSSDAQSRLGTRRHAHNRRPPS